MKPTTSQFTDNQLWNRFKDGDKEAFSLLYQRHIRSLFNYGLKLSQDKALLQDTLQELFIEFWKKREKLSEVNCVKVYFIKAFRYKLLHALSKSKKLRHISIDELLDDIPGVIVDDQEFAQLRKKKLKEILKTLPERQRSVIHLKYFQQLSNQEIAEILNVNYQSVSNLLQRGLKKLKGQMELP